MNKVCNMVISGFMTAFLGMAPMNSFADGIPNLAGLVEQRSSALVTVKYLLVVNMGRGMESENESELTCVMIDAKGILLCPNNQMSGFISMIKQLTGPAGLDISATPKNLKVIVENEEERFDAEIIARDSELDINWIQITNAESKSFAFIDFSDNTDIGSGDAAVVIRRTGDNLGRTTVASTFRIGGVASKPRRLYIPDNPIMLSSGMPVFAAGGGVVGLMITQPPEPAGGNNSPILGFGNAMKMQESMMGLVLPAEAVVRATERAMAVEEP